MIQLIAKPVYAIDGKLVSEDGTLSPKEKTDAYKGTIAYSILSAHNQGEVKKDGPLNLRFDKMLSHDITYVGIIQTARASGLEKFPIPYALTNCHNSLCAVGGTINEDDHVFGLSAAKKYGGIFVPPHLAVIHQYAREMMAFSGGMILGSDSHTRYGALGCLAIGEGGPELVKQLLKKTYDIRYPDVVAVELKGKPVKGVGPQDVALAIIGAVFEKGFVKNAVLEFIGDGIRNLSVDYRNGIDVMTTETTCLSSIWETDALVAEYYKTMGREDDYKKLAPKKIAMYDRAVTVDLSKIRPMIALPFHPSNVYPIDRLLEKPIETLKEAEERARASIDDPKIDFRLTDKIQNGKIRVEQGIIAGCAGGNYENVVEAASILKGASTGNGEFSLSVYPSSQPVFDKLIGGGQISALIESGAVVKTAFCGPCFGAGDTPANNALSIRHTTRNFPSREGSKPGQGQISSVCLMDARSIAATAANGGMLTQATDVDYDNSIPKYTFNQEIYRKRVYNGFGRPETQSQLKFGPNIADWPEMQPLKGDMLLEITSAIFDPVTTTDELIPSGETSSYRSNPMKLADFTLSRKDPQYVERAKKNAETARRFTERKELSAAYETAFRLLGVDTRKVQIASCIFAVKPGDGSAREQAASCQRVLGGGANIACEYATKRYRSNVINWGMIPFLSQNKDFKVGDLIYIKDVAEFISSGKNSIAATLLRDGKTRELTLEIAPLTESEKDIILSGCLINYYKSRGKRNVL